MIRERKSKWLTAFPLSIKFLTIWTSFATTVALKGRSLMKKIFIKRAPILGMPIKNGKVGCELKHVMAAKTLCNDHANNLTGVIK